MTIIPNSRIRRYVAIVGVFLIMAALITGFSGFYFVGGDICTLSDNLEIRTWYDLDAIRDNLDGNHILMNDLDSTTAGYEELAGPTANGGKGWQPIGSSVVSVATPCGVVAAGVGVGWYFLTGTFDGHGYEIRDLFINRPDENFVGLLGGLLNDGAIKNIGVVNVTVTGHSFVGGLVGDNGGGGYTTGHRGIVSNSYAIGSVTGISYVGGLVGKSGRSGNVSDSYFSGHVTGNQDVGGLVGLNFIDEYGLDATVSNSYSTGDVTGNEEVGGLVGLNDGTVSNSYSTCSVTGVDDVGGLVGASIGTVNDSFWDIETSGRSTSAGGTGKNTTAMKDIATFSGASWNIITVALNDTNPAYTWNIVNNVTYPFFSWQS